MTVIKVMHITISSFHINLYANKSYLIGTSRKKLSRAHEMVSPSHDIASTGCGKKVTP